MTTCKCNFGKKIISEKFAQRFPQTETMRDISFSLGAVTNQLQMGTKEGLTPSFPQTLIYTVFLHHPTEAPIGLGLWDGSRSGQRQIP